MENRSDQFPVKGRFVVAAWLIPLFYLPGFEFIYSSVVKRSEWFWFDVAYVLYYQLIFAASLALLVVCYRVNWRLMFAPAKAGEYLAATKLTAFVFIFSMFAGYALFYPLSFVLPEFVNFWFIELPPIIYSSQNTYPIIPNLLNLLTLVVLAPVLEEFAFRGFLLHRWTARWGIKPAILCSSLLFAVAHPDIIGAFAFGVAMCIVYLRTQTLVIPMVCHALYNLVVWLIEAGTVAVAGPQFNYTLEQFQSEWPLGLGCGIISALWVYIYLNGKRSKKPWFLPEV